MSQGFCSCLVSLTMSSWGNDVIVGMVVDTTAHTIGSLVPVYYLYS